MLDVYQIAEKASKINPTELMFYVLSRVDIQQLMIKLNTENQLNELNENADGIKLNTIGGNYSPSYAKSKKSSPFKINLKLTGKYYTTFKVVPLRDGTAEIKSNKKIHGSDTFLNAERWGEVEGLNEQNTNIVLQAIEEEIFKHVFGSLLS